LCNGAKDPRKGLERLSALGQRLVIRANHLPADLALLGLLEDLRGAASAVLALSESAPSFTIYPLTRTVFEATQRIIALATDDDYLRAGTLRQTRRSADPTTSCARTSRELCRNGIQESCQGWGYRHLNLTA
jgi:hypothetical protein